MGKIEKIEKYQTVDYSNDEIEYFIQEDNIVNNSYPINSKKKKLVDNLNSYKG